MTDLYNPFTGEVSKAVSPMYGAKDAFANQPTRKVAALLPTGKHVSHANDLHVTRHGKRKNVGRYGETKLERFGKADETVSKDRDRKGAAKIGAGVGIGTMAVTTPMGMIGARRAGFQSMSHALGGKGRTAGLLATEGAVRAGLGAGVGAAVGRKRRVAKNFTDLGSQPGMVNPGVVTSSWSHGTPNQNFAASSGRRGRKIA